MTVLDEPNACKPATAPTPADGLDALSEAPWRRFHTIAVLLFGVGWAMDAFEVTLVGNVMGALGARFHLGAQAMSVLLAAWFFGLMLGAAWFGRFASVSFFYGATALATIALAFVTGFGAGAIMAGFALTNLLATASWIAAYPTFSELFPTHLRATGIGASVAVGRIGAMIAPFLVAALGARSMAAALFLLAGFWLLGALAMVVWRVAGGIEGSGMALERIAPVAAASGA